MVEYATITTEWALKPGEVLLVSAEPPEATTARGEKAYHVERFASVQDLLRRTHRGPAPRVRVATVGPGVRVVGADKEVSPEQVLELMRTMCPESCCLRRCNCGDCEGRCGADNKL